MRKLPLIIGLFVGSIPFVALAQDAVIAQPDALKWGDPPPYLTPGPQAAGIVGDPSKAVPYVVRLKLPAGYKVMPHNHPNDENVTVISGEFHLGIGDKFDDTKGQIIKPGGYAQTPKGVNHFAWTGAETIIQLHGVGPGGLTYVNPADDPRKK
jgi:quercetin dioxygenase-like cupin family protein